MNIIKLKKCYVKKFITEKNLKLINNSVGKTQDYIKNTNETMRTYIWFTKTDKTRKREII